jgi:predicted metal-dependent peptidase
MAKQETTDTGVTTKGPYVHPDFPELSEEVLKAKARAFNIDDHLVALTFAEPFYGDVIRALHKTMTDAVPTAGVVCSNDMLSMYYNPMFLGAYSPRVVRGIMMHEAMHLVLQHTTTRRYEPFAIWNWATDLAINGSIAKDMLPDCGLFPGHPLKLPANFDSFPEERQQQLLRISSLIESFPDNLSSEQYFGLLMDNQDVQDMMGEESGLEGLGEMDDHGQWGDLSDEEREWMKAKVHQVVKEATEKADSKNTWGSVPAEMREEIRRLVKGEIDWKAVLRRFTGYSYRADRMTSVYRANRKYPGIHPGHSRDYKPRLAVYIDQSGSVGDETLELFFGELGSLSSRVEITVYHFDTSVDGDSKAIWKRGKIPRPHRTRCGGTCFDAPTAHAAKGGFDGYIICTDGGAPKPARSKTRRCWVLGPGDELAFDDVDRRDTVVKMKRPGIQRS